MCGACNMSDYDVDLPGGYSYASEGRRYHMIFGPQTIYPDIIRYKVEDHYILVLQKPHRFLYSDLFADDLSSRYYFYNFYFHDSLDSKYNSERKAIVGDSTLYRIFKSKGVSLANSAKDKRIARKIADSIIANNPIQKKIFSLSKVYWIIDTQNQKLNGPLSKKEFSDQRRLLGLQANL